MTATMGEDYDFLGPSIGASGSSPETVLNVEVRGRAVTCLRNIIEARSHTPYGFGRSARGASRVRRFSHRTTSHPLQVDRAGTKITRSEKRSPDE